MLMTIPEKDGSGWYSALLCRVKLSERAIRTFPLVALRWCLAPIQDDLEPSRLINFFFVTDWDGWCFCCRWSRNKVWCTPKDWGIAVIDTSIAAGTIAAGTIAAERDGVDWDGCWCPSLLCWEKLAT
jgi:hypothetical protein